MWQKNRRLWITIQLCFNLYHRKKGNESVGCPYCRGCTGITYKIDEQGNQTTLASLSKFDQKTLKDIHLIRDLDTFKSKYKNLFSAIRVKCLGRKEDKVLKKQLNELKTRILDGNFKIDNDEFNQKFYVLYEMANGKIQNVDNAKTVA